jgi:hypothetical protein
MRGGAIDFFSEMCYIVLTRTPWLPHHLPPAHVSWTLNITDQMEASREKLYVAVALLVLVMPQAPASGMDEL